MKKVCSSMSRCRERRGRLRPCLSKICDSYILDANQVEPLTKLYSYLYKVQVSTLTVLSIFEQYSSGTINGVLFGSQKTRTASSAAVIANWDSELF